MAFISKLKKSENSADLFASTVLKLIAFSLTVGFSLRIVLLFHTQSSVEFNAENIFKIFVLGAVNDIFYTLIVSFFIWLDLIFLSKAKYKKPTGYIILGLLVLALIYVSFFNTIFHEYGSVVPEIVQYLLLYKTLSFAIRLFFPAIRNRWSFAVYALIIFLYVTAIIMFFALGEYLFWDEFGVRYNFIAVDYLIYTNEVVGNIAESYPIVTILLATAALASVVTFFMLKGVKKGIETPMTLKQKVRVSVEYFCMVAFSVWALGFNTRFQNGENTFVNELQANGGFKFYQAFQNSKLEYKDFYALLPIKKAEQIVNQEYNSKGIENWQQIQDSLPENKKNIVLITVESLSASFMNSFGNQENITPNLDKLATESLFFTKLFATGNRTVRGLEAVSLLRPPSAGESIVKQPNNSDLFSIGKVLKNKGYKVQFLYGGDSYFDNMKTFFGGNNYEIIDKTDFDKTKITFSNIWGVCDEDMFEKALQIFDKNESENTPFFGHIMTVSNHRPYTYPEGKIDIPADSKSRAGGVKYSDYAIGKFIEKAKTKSWFKNTVFVIVADHCASSAGRTSLPLERYHIPAMIYAPGFVQPSAENRLVSQLDVLPTLFGLLHFSYESRFFGQDIYKANYQERAFIATYQNLGYLQNDILTVLSPNQKVEQFTVNQKSEEEYEMLPKQTPDSVLIKKAIANYQLSSYQK